MAGLNTIENRRRILLNSPHIDKVSGELITFKTINKKPNGCCVHFLASQEGSGDPSPTNVRNIVGLSGLTINVSSVEYPITWGLIAGTLYGGYLDAITGQLLVTHVYKELHGGEDNWSYDTGSKQIFEYRWDEVRGTGNAMCNMTVPNDITYGEYPSYPNIINVSRSTYNIKIHVVDWDMTIYSFFEWLSENPIQLVCPLITPISYQITPQDIRTSKGSNMAWCDPNGIMEIEYWTY